MHGCLKTLSVQRLVRTYVQPPTFTPSAFSVLYSSATGASEPLHLGYMTRMLPAGFRDTFDLVATLKKAGLGSLELFCMGLKATGCYLARTLSYKGAEFQLERIHLDPEFRWEGNEVFRATRTQAQPALSTQPRNEPTSKLLCPCGGTSCHHPVQGDVRARGRVLAAAARGGAAHVSRQDAA